MRIPKSTYYYKPKDKNSTDMDIVERIEEIALKFSCCAGHEKYIRIASSFVYLAALIDGLSRSLSADLAIAALLDAISKRDTSNLVHHSDQGIQYCSSEYVNILKDHKIAISMSGRANPYDNAKIESFFRTLKVEEVYMFEYETYKEVLSRIPYFIEEVYNNKRLHSSLGYMPPEEFENINNKNIKVNESHQLVLS